MWGCWLKWLLVFAHHTYSDNNLKFMSAPCACTYMILDIMLYCCLYAATLLLQHLLKLLNQNRNFADTYLIFLWKLEVVVGFQALQMICQVHNWDWRVVSHTCQSDGLKVNHQPCIEGITQAQANSESLDKQHVCLTGGMEEWFLLG